MSLRGAELVVASFAKLPSDHREFADRFYAHLFDAAPELRGMFSDDLDTQKEKLMATLTVMVRAAGDLDKIRDMAKELGRTHLEYGVAQEHYGILRDCLVLVLREILGDDFGAGEEAAWVEFYDTVAAMMVQH